MRTTPRTSNLLAILALLIAALVVFGDLLVTGGNTIVSRPEGDLVAQFLAWRKFAFGELAHGHVPLWNPYFYSGAPFLGGFQSALLYPPNWLYMVFPLGLAVNVDVTLNIFLSGVFTFFWARRHGLHPLAAALGGLVYMLGGAHFLHVTGGHLSNLCTIVWAPLIFLAIDIVNRAEDAQQVWRGAWLGAGATAMQILAGHPQYVYYTGMIAGIYAIIGLYHSPQRRGALVGFATIVLVSAALSAAQLLTGLSAAAECYRHAVPLADAGTFPFPPENLLTLIAPDFFGDFSRDQSYWGRWHLWEDSMFIGVTALTLAIFGAVRGPKRFRWHCIIMAAVALILALGAYTPVYEPLYYLLPGFASFRGASKFIFLALLFIAMLSAMGMDRLLRTRMYPRGPAKILLLAGVLIAGAGGAIWTSASAGAPGTPDTWAWWGWWTRMMARINFSSESHVFQPPPGRPAYFVACGHLAAQSLFLCAATFAVLALLWWNGRRWRFLLHGIAVLAAVELCLFARANRGELNMRGILGAEDQLHNQLAQFTPDSRVASPRGTGVKPGQIMLAGGYSIFGDDPMVLSRYAELGDYAERFGRRAAPTTQPTTQPATTRPSGPTTRPQLTDALLPASPSLQTSGTEPGLVDALLPACPSPQPLPAATAPTKSAPTSRPAAIVPSTPDLATIFILNSPSPLWRLFRLQYRYLSSDLRRPPTRLPWRTLDRATLVPRCKIVPNTKDALEILEDLSIPLQEVVILQGHVDPMLQEVQHIGASYALTKAGDGSVTIKDLSSDAMEINVWTSRPAMLLISDNYSPGWRVRSLDENPDQAEYTIVPADVALRGISLLAGRHHLLMEYRPWGWTAGRWISLTSLVIYFGWGIRLWRRKKRDDAEKVS